MQNDDGGWAAFDKTRRPADARAHPLRRSQRDAGPELPRYHRACARIAGPQGLTIKTLGPRGPSTSSSSQQDACGAWWGRWGVNYIYGTWQVLTGLQRVGEDMNSPYIHRAVDWLPSVQKPDGSFGRNLRQLR